MHILESLIISVAQCDAELLEMPRELFLRVYVTLAATTAYLAKCVEANVALFAREQLTTHGEPARRNRTAQSIQGIYLIADQLPKTLKARSVFAIGLDEFPDIRTSLAMHGG